MYEAYREIYEQGESLGRSLKHIRAYEHELKAFFSAKDHDEILFIACGSSYWLSLSAAATFEDLTGVRCTALKSGDVVLGPEPYLKAHPKALIIAPSRSGTTDETLRAIRIFKEAHGNRVLAFAEYPDSPIAGEADLVIEIPWANEIGILQTRSFANLYLLCVALAALIGDDGALLKELEVYIASFPGHARRAEAFAESIVKDFPACSSLVCLGHGRQYGVVIEAAYISVEMNRFPAFYYGTLEFRHGPIVICDPSFLVAIFSWGAGRDHEEKMASEIRGRGAKVLAISDMGDFQNADFRLGMGQGHRPEVLALFGIMVMQGFAYHMTLRDGGNPDKPKDLVPWISL
jgi:fructoselysine-6-P-deglycase FrlB-like protein